MDKSTKSDIEQPISKPAAKVFFECECLTEGVTVERDEEYKQVYLQCFVSSFSAKQGLIRQFLKRLSIMWSILRKGEYMFFDLVLSYQMADELGKTLIQKEVTKHE